jgi:hypothetical protein
MSKFSKSVLIRIKKEDGHPISKWLFVLERVLILAVFLFLTILSSFILSLILFRFEDLDLDIDTQYQGFSIIYAFPYLWLLLAIIAIVGAYCYFKKTPRGYRFRLLTIVVMLIAVVATVGTVGYLSRFPQFFDEAIQESPLYKYFNYDKYALWARPEEGFLSGEITEVISDGKFLLKDFDGKEWNLNVSNAQVIDKGVELKVGIKIKILGETEGGGFKVEEIRAWCPVKK